MDREVRDRWQLLDRDVVAHEVAADVVEDPRGLIAEEVEEERVLHRVHPRVPDDLALRVQDERVRPLSRLHRRHVLRDEAVQEGDAVRAREPDLHPVRVVDDPRRCADAEDLGVQSGVARGDLPARAVDEERTAQLVPGPQRELSHHVEVSGAADIRVVQRFRRARLMAPGAMARTSGISDS